MSSNTKCRAARASSTHLDSRFSLADNGDPESPTEDYDRDKEAPDCPKTTITATFVCFPDRRDPARIASGANSWQDLRESFGPVLTRRRRPCLLQFDILILSQAILSQAISHGTVDFMSSEENKDHTPPTGSEEPIVAKLAKGPADGSSSEADADRESESSGGDDFGLGGEGEQSDPKQSDPKQSDPEQGGPATDESIRVGSPFAVDPNPIAGTSIRLRRVKPEAFYDVGPLRYTAMGAVSAAVLVLGFAAAAAWWFPGGGTIIAALGCALSIFGLYSNRKLVASGCLVLHLMLFMISYSRAITA